MVDPPLSRVTRHIATRKESANYSGAQAAAVEKAEFSRWWLVTYACGAVRFQPAEFYHVVSTWCPEHQAEHIDTAVQLTRKAWRTWQLGLGARRGFTSAEWRVFCASLSEQQEGP